MKKIILSLCCVFAAFLVQAQKTEIVTTPRALEKTSQLTALLSLDDAQQKKVLRIQQRKDQQLSEIVTLENSDHQKYQQKLAGIHKGNEIAIQNLLTKEQLKVYHGQRMEIRRQKASLYKEMNAAGASKKDIEQAMRQLEYDFDS